MLKVYSVATVLTVYGIETAKSVCHHISNVWQSWLQQYLPFTVLKLIVADDIGGIVCIVATVLTVYGIETQPVSRIAA